MTISSGRSTDTSSKRSTALSRSIADGPFRRNGLLTRALPFAAVAILAEVSLALPPGPQSAGYTASSVILLVAVLVAVPLALWNRLPQWMTVLVPVALVAWVLTLTLATGSATSGIEHCDPRATHLERALPEALGVIGRRRRHSGD